MVTSCIFSGTVAFFCLISAWTMSRVMLLDVFTATRYLNRSTSTVSWDMSPVSVLSASVSTSRSKSQWALSRSSSACSFFFLCKSFWALANSQNSINAEAVESLLNFFLQKSGNVSESKATCQEVTFLLSSARTLRLVNRRFTIASTYRSTSTAGSGDAPDTMKVCSSASSAASSAVEWLWASLAVSTSVVGGPSEASN